MDKNSTISQVSLLHSNRNYDHKVQQTKQTQSGHMQNSRRLPRSTNFYFHPLVSVFIFQSKYKSYKFKKYSIEICWLTRELSKKKSNQDILNGSIGAPPLGKLLHVSPGNPCQYSSQAVFGHVELFGADENKFQDKDQVGTFELNHPLIRHHSYSACL